MTPARLLYKAAGYPKSPKSTVNTNTACWLCGLPCNEIGVSVIKAVGESFTDYANVAVPESKYVCVPCVWVLSGRPPDTFRLYSVIWRTDRPLAASHPKATRVVPGAQLTAKNDLIEIRTILLDPPTDGSPWFCAIADSGQKHIVPFTSLNHGADQWIVRLEDDNIHGSPAKFGGIVHHCSVLYAAGFNRKEILEGRPAPRKLAKLGSDIWRQYGQSLDSKRGGGLLDLAVFLLRKKGIEDVIRETERFSDHVYL